MLNFTIKFSLGSLYNSFVKYIIAKPTPHIFSPYDTCTHQSFRGNFIRIFEYILHLLLSTDVVGVALRLTLHNLRMLPQHNTLRICAYLYPFLYSQFWLYIPRQADVSRVLLYAYIWYIHLYIHRGHTHDQHAKWIV